MSQSRVTRREALRGLFRRPPSAPEETHGPDRVDPEAPGDAPEPPPQVAIIQGRQCLAYRSLSCSVCAERCPEPGAIIRERGIPRVDPMVCTGCGICQEVCPAPQNAVLVMPAPPKTLPMNWGQANHGI